MISDIKGLTHDRAEQLIARLKSINHNIKVIEIFEDDGKRYILTTLYSDPQTQPLVFEQSAKALAIASLTQFLTKDRLGQVVSYECEFDYPSNKFVESASYSSETSSQREQLNTLKQNLEEVKVLSNQLHLGTLTIEGLETNNQNTKRGARFNEAIDHLIQTLS